MSIAEAGARVNARVVAREEDEPEKNPNFSDPA
jgi:hypothetical protein